jgi:hypothetical protein
LKHPFEKTSRFGVGLLRFQISAQGRNHSAIIAETCNKNTKNINTPKNKLKKNTSFGFFYERMIVKYP